MSFRIRAPRRALVTALVAMLIAGPMALLPTGAAIAVNGAPSAVNNFAAVRTSDSTTHVSWTAPSDRGDGIQGYSLYQRPVGTSTWNHIDFGGGFGAGGPDLTQWDFTAADPSLRYEFRINAYNGGDGEVPDVTTTESFAAPGFVTGITAVAGVKQLAINWGRPNGALGTVTYKVSYRVHPAGTWQVWSDSTNTSATITGLTPGVEYGFAVVSSNPGGSGSTVSGTRTPVAPTPVAPGAPTNIVPTFFSSMMTLQWTTPSSTGTADVLHYTVETRTQGATDWTLVGEYGSTVTSPLPATNKLRDFRIATVTADGISEYAYLYGVAFAGVVPGTPAAPSLTPGAASLLMTWNAPAAPSGSSAITSYDARLTQTNASGSIVSTLTDLSYTVDQSVLTTTLRLDPNATYTLQLRAVNATGAGAWSNGTTATTLHQLPSAPPNFVPTFDAGGAKFSWDAPTDAGSAEHLYYVVDARTSDGGTWHNSTETTDRTFGLGWLGRYDFRVASVTTAGIGEYTYLNSLTQVGFTPGQPTSLTLTSGDRSLTATWTAPASNPQTPAATSYELWYRMPGSTNWTDHTPVTTSATTVTLRGLSLRDYEVYVVPTSVAGEGAASDISRLTVAAVPNTIDSSSVTRGDGQLTVTYQAPAANNSPIVRYEARAMTPSGVFIYGTTSTSLSATVTGLANGTSYRIDVRAVNAVGTGVWSTGSTGTPAGVPSQVAPFTIISSDHSLIPTWTRATTNGSAIVGYDVRYRVLGSSVWIDHARTTTTNITISGLTNATTYEVQVRAVNDVGAGAWSASATRSPAGTSFAVTTLEATSGDYAATLNWTEPDLNGSIVKSYSVRYSTNGVSWVGGGATEDTTIEVSPLANGAEYQFQVQAVTTTGLSPWSNIAKATPAGAPLAPRVTLVAGDQKIEAEWEVWGNGAAITSYDVRYRDATDWVERSIDASDERATIDALTNGAEYEVQVRAVNSVGAGTWSTAKFATPAGVPFAPVVTQTRGDGQVRLDWAPANSNGSDISRYEVNYAGSDWTPWTEVSDDHAIITGLTNGERYKFQVRAVNGVGNGVWSSAGTVTPAGAPGDVTGLDWSPVADGVSLTWSAPTSNNGAAITGYEVEYRAADSSGAYTAVTATSTAKTISGLGNNVAYDVRVRAVNGAVDAAWVSTTARAGIVPTAPTALALTGGDESLTATWTASTFSGGSPVTGYEVTFSPKGANVPAGSPNVFVTGTTATLVGLINSTEYDVQVRALTDAASGEWSSVASAYPFTFAAKFTSVDGEKLTSVKPGDKVRVSGTESLPGAEVFVELHSTPVSLGTTTVAPDGSFSLVVTIPTSAAAGKHTLYAGLAGSSGLVADASLAVTVVAAVNADGTLSITGIDEGSLALALWLALALAVTGATLLVTRRRTNA